MIVLLTTATTWFRAAAQGHIVVNPPQQQYRCASLCVRNFFYTRRTRVPTTGSFRFSKSICLTVFPERTFPMVLRNNIIRSFDVALSSMSYNNLLQLIPPRDPVDPRNSNNKKYYIIIYLNDNIIPNTETTVTETTSPCPVWACMVTSPSLHFIIFVKVLSTLAHQSPGCRRARVCSCVNIVLILAKRRNWRAAPRSLRSRNQTHARTSRTSE